MEAAYVFAPLGVFFLCCQLVLCRAARYCRWSNHWLFPCVAEAGDYLPTLLGSISMASIPDEPSAVVLLLYLIVLNNSMAAYDREKVKLRYLWTAVNFTCFAYRALSAVSRADMGSKGRYAWAYAIVLAMICSYAYCNVFAALRAGAGKHYSEAVAEHMSRTEHVPQTRNQYNASTLEGYRYVVLLDPKKRTVDQIPDLEASYSSGGEEKQQQQQQHRKDLCLSFALFQLLFCLYHGVPWLSQEATGRQKCQRLVVEGLLRRRPPPPLPPPQQQQQQQQHQEEEEASCYDKSTARGFGVVEAELAFLHDHTHGGYILWWYPGAGAGACRALYYVLRAAMAVIMYIAGLALYLTCEGDRRPPRVSVIISPLLLYLLFDALQVVFYCRSDRRMVSYLCHPGAWQHRCFGWLVSLIRRFPSCTTRNFCRLDSVGQYSLLEEATPHTHSGGRPSLTPFHQASLYSHCAKPSVPVALPPTLKLRIAEVLGGTSCPVAVPREVQQAQEFQGGEPKQKIAIILKWHIATSYCDMKQLQQQQQQQQQQQDGYPESREVAVVLSKYCAYLVAFCPELLPCPDTLTRRTFCNVLNEVTSLVGGQQRSESRLAMLDARRKSGNVFGGGFARDTDILTDGLRLGHLLITAIGGQSQRNLWMILESIWVKLILSVAPQGSTDDATYARTHAKYLAQGGEFLTYLWAMLSHAGIQKHSAWRPCIANQRVSTYLWM